VSGSTLKIRIKAAVRVSPGGARSSGGSAFREDFGNGESLVSCTIAEDSVSADTYEAKREDVLEKPLRERAPGDLHGENGQAIRWDRAFLRSRSSMDTFTYRD
jgi:hypothetical protein